MCLQGEGQFSSLVLDCKVVLLKMEQHPLKALRSTYGNCQWFHENRLKWFVVRFNVDFLATTDIGVKTITGKHNWKNLFHNMSVSCFPQV